MNAYLNHFYSSGLEGITPIVNILTPKRKKKPAAKGGSPKQGKETPKKSPKAAKKSSPNLSKKSTASETPSDPIIIED